MIREIGWYLEDGRFSNIVSELDALADECALSISAQSPDRFSKRQNLIDAVAWHLEASGLADASEAQSIVDERLFSNGDLNREALDILEKELIKAHMYQKHLWEYMGTMSLYSPISKRALERDGYDFNDYVPISYKAEHKDKSPISGILEGESAAVPIYAYNDGTVSTEYDAKKGRLDFNSLQDNSGFDWGRKGWDPNYEVEKEWHGTFTSSGEWIEVQEKGVLAKPRAFVTTQAPVQALQLIKDGDGVILYDPYYEFLYAYVASRFSQDEDTELMNDERISAVVASVRSSMETLKAGKITSIVRNPYANRLSEDEREDIPKFASMIEDDAKVSGIYKRIFSDLMADEPEFKSISQAKAAQRIQEDMFKSEERRKKGEDLALRFAFSSSMGLKGDEAIDAVFSGSANMPLNRSVASDLQFAGLEESESERVLNMEIPPSKASAFNRALFNALANFSAFSNSGYSKGDLVDDVYAKVVMDQDVKREVDIEVTLDDLLENGSGGLVDGDLTENERKLFDQAQEEILSEAHPSYRDRLARTLERARDAYPLVKGSVSITPQELLAKARDIFKRQNKVVTDVGITYKSFAKREIQEEKIRLFKTVDIGKFIDESGKAEERRRVRDYALEFSQFEEKSEVPADLFSNEGENAFLESDLFKNSLMDEGRVREIIENEKDSADASLAQSSVVLSSAVRKIPIPALYSDFERLSSTEKIEPTNEDASYLERLFGPDILVPSMFSEGMVFYAYLANAALVSAQGEDASPSPSTSDSLEVPEHARRADEGFSEISEEEEARAGALEAQAPFMADASERETKRSEEAESEGGEEAESEGARRKADEPLIEKPENRAKVPVQEETGNRALADIGQAGERDDGKDAFLSVDESPFLKNPELQSEIVTQRRADEFSESDGGETEEVLRRRVPAERDGDGREGDLAPRRPREDEGGSETEEGLRRRVPAERDGDGILDDSSKRAADAPLDGNEDAGLGEAAASSRRMQRDDEAIRETDAARSSAEIQDREPFSQESRDAKKAQDARTDESFDLGDSSKIEDGAGDDTSEAYDHRTGKINIYDRTAKSDDGIVFVNKNGDSFMIVNDLARDYKYKVPAEIVSETRSPLSSKTIGKENYIDRVRGRSRRASAQAGALLDAQTASKIDGMLRRWAISEGFVYLDVGKNEIVYDKGLAVYAFAKKFPETDYVSHFQAQIAPEKRKAESLDSGSSGSDSDLGLPDYAPHAEEGASLRAPTFTGYPEFNKRAGNAKDGSRSKGKGSKKPSSGKEDIDEAARDKAASDEAAREEAERIKRSLERYIEDRKNMEPFIESCIKDMDRGRINAQAARAQQMLLSKVISTLENRIVK